MCTLIIGRDVVAPGSVLLAANRDEDPGRPSDPPGILCESPRLVGGRDRRAGGTWLAVREARAVVALLNRRDVPGEPAPGAPGLRSRGALVLEVAGAADDAPVGSTPPAAPSGGRPEPGSRAADGPTPPPDGDHLADAALRRAAALVRGARFAPCTLLFASPRVSWLMTLETDGMPRFEPLASGWHVLTHADLDDPGEPRTAWLVGALAGFAPSSPDEAGNRLDALLRSHGDPAAGIPPVCLHRGAMRTVSASSVWLTAGEARYRHAEGRPCEHPFADHSHLLRAPRP